MNTIEVNIKRKSKEEVFFLRFKSDEKINFVKNFLKFMSFKKKTKVIQKNEEKNRLYNLDNVDKNYSSNSMDLMKLPLYKRKKILEYQSKKAASIYNNNNEWKELLTGDFIEYK
ncbi:MAG: hypothetical protein FVQ77_15390 [Cytophagales bacterium]|nr:hypothetical protein [Cytophagales bacterium]